MNNYYININILKWKRKINTQKREIKKQTAKIEIDVKEILLYCVFNEGQQMKLLETEQKKNRVKK